MGVDAEPTCLQRGEGRVHDGSRLAVYDVGEGEGYRGNAGTAAGVDVDRLLYTRGSGLDVQHNLGLAAHVSEGGSSSLGAISPGAHGYGYSISLFGGDCVAGTRDEERSRDQADEQASTSESQTH
jgi:hypothetical protein